MSEHKNIGKALLAVQMELGPVQKDATNPHFGRTFPSLAAVIEATMPILNKHGIVLIQSPIAPTTQNHLTMQTILLHPESGEQIESTAVVPLVKSDPQAYGSALTYARRYSLESIIGLQRADDDGEGAMGRDNEKAPQRMPPNTKSPAPKSPPVKGAEMSDTQAQSAIEAIESACIEAKITSEGCVQIQDRMLKKLKVPNIKAAGADNVRKLLKSIKEGKYYSNGALAQKA